MRFKKMTTIWVPFLYILSLFISLTNAQLRYAEKRSIVDNFMGPTASRFFYNGNIDSDVTRAFLPDSRLTEYQHSQNADFILQYPVESQQVAQYVYENRDPNCQEFYNPPNIQNVPYIPEQPYYPNYPYIPNNPGFQNTPFIPATSNVQNPQYVQTSPNVQPPEFIPNYPEIQPIPTVPDVNPPKIPVRPSNSFIPTNSNNQKIPKSSPSDDPNPSDTSKPSKSPVIFPESSVVKESLVISNYSEKKTDYTKFPEEKNTVVDIKTSANRVNLQPNPELSEIAHLSSFGYTENRPQPVIPLIPVNTLEDEGLVNIDLSPIFDDEDKKETRTKKEDWIEIPKYYYQPVAPNDVSKGRTETTFSVQKTTINGVPAGNKPLTSDPWLDNAANEIYNPNELPYPNFNNLEDLLNRTMENKTTIVYTRMSDYDNNNPKNMVPMSLSLKIDSGKDIVDNFLTEPDPENPPAPINRQPNTLLIEDWLEQNKKRYNELTPEEQKKFNEANEFLFSGKFTTDISEDDKDDVQLIPLKDLYLVADKPPLTQFKVRLDDSKIISDKSNQLNNTKDDKKDKLSNTTSNQDKQLYNVENTLTTTSKPQIDPPKLLPNAVTVKTKVSTVDKHNTEREELSEDLLKLFDPDFNRKNGIKTFDSTSNSNKKSETNSGSTSSVFDINNVPIYNIPPELSSTADILWSSQNNKAVKTNTSVKRPTSTNNSNFKPATATNNRKPVSATQKAVTTNTNRKPASVSGSRPVATSNVRRPVSNTVRRPVQTTGSRPASGNTPRRPVSATGSRTTSRNTVRRPAQSSSSILITMFDRIIGDLVTSTLRELSRVSGSTSNRNTVRRNTH